MIATVIPFVLTDHPSKILLNIYWLYPRPQSRQQQVPPLAIIHNHALSVSDVLEDIHMLCFFPDVSACGGTSPGHVFSTQIEVTSLVTKQETI